MTEKYEALTWSLFILLMIGSFIFLIYARVFNITKVIFVFLGAIVFFGILYFFFSKITIKSGQLIWFLLAFILSLFAGIPLFMLMALGCSVSGGISCIFAYFFLGAPFIFLGIYIYLYFKNKKQKVLDQK